MNFRELTAVVTGSSSGIGLGMAEAFAAAGCRLVINGIATPEQAESLSQRLRQQQGAQVLFHHADLADPEQCAKLIRKAEEHFGSVDILINNAGIQHVAPTECFPVDRWNAILAVNLSSAFHTIRTALPGMHRRNYGRIINTASVHGLVASVRHQIDQIGPYHRVYGHRWGFSDHQTQQFELHHDHLPRMRRLRLAEGYRDYVVSELREPRKGIEALLCSRQLAR